MTRPEFTPRISLGDAMAALAGILAAAGFTWSQAGDIKVQAQRISAIEQTRMDDERIRARDEARLTEALREIKDNLRRVEDKLDRQAALTAPAERPRR
ncbi:MAG: hypothetical protein KAY59_10915 [Acidobacteria bacterium]|nr:hypothetical protein [Acidobacteriota bacterium]